MISSDTMSTNEDSSTMSSSDTMSTNEDSSTMISIDGMSSADEMTTKGKTYDVSAKVSTDVPLDLTAASVTTTPDNSMCCAGDQMNPNGIGCLKGAYSSNVFCWKDVRDMSKLVLCLSC